MTDYTLFVYANEKLRRIYFNHVYIIYGSYISIIFNTTEKMLLADGEPLLYNNHITILVQRFG